MSTGRKTDRSPPVIGQRNVVITPLNLQQLLATSRQLHHNSTASPQLAAASPTRIIEKATLRAVSQGAVYKKESAKSFILRSIDCSKVISCGDLKGVIQQQLKQDVISGDFDVGYVQGTNVIRVRSRQDIQEMWPEVVKGKIMLWCDGLRGNKTSAGRLKRKLSEFEGEELDDDDEDPLFGTTKKKRQPATRSKEGEVQEYVDSLKGKHGTTFTPMQLRIWGEMMVSGLHNSTDDPPNTSMFLRAGGKPMQKQNSQPQVTQLVADAATAIASAFAAPPTSSNQQLGADQLIDSRTKLYKQLSDLKSLHSMGVLTDEEYLSQKQTTMEILDSYKPKKHT